jgi:hypothetical protein
LRVVLSPGGKGNEGDGEQRGRITDFHNEYPLLVVQPGAAPRSALGLYRRAPKGFVSGEG